MHLEFEFIVMSLTCVFVGKRRKPLAPSEVVKKKLEDLLTFPKAERHFKALVTEEKLE